MISGVGPAFERPSVLERTRKFLLPILTGLLVVCLLPYLHLGVIYRFWIVKEKEEVDRLRCRCSCWDTLFKGSYESGVAGYKHVYFNITSNSFCIWVCTALCLVALYEAVCYLVRLLVGKNLRISMVVLFLIVLYPHYYSWWAYFNYLNDDFYKQWNHQIFFTVTELISTFVVIWLCDRRREARPILLLIIIDVAILHIFAAGADQFVKNVIYGKGRGYQFYRDIGFMVPDLFHLLIPTLEWMIWLRANGKGFKDSLSHWYILASGMVVTALYIILQRL